MIHLHNIYACVQVKWTHVRGHAGIYGNEQADKLATDGAKLR